MIDKVRTTVKSKTSKARNSDSKIGKFSNILNSPLMQGKNYNLIKGSKNSESFTNQIISKNSPSVKDTKFRRLSSIQNTNTFIEPIIDENLSMNILLKEYEKYPPGETSKGKIGQIKSFAFNSYHGLVKEENEDRVCVSTLIKKPHNKKMQQWPRISFFGVFDGHGGEACSSFLKHNFVNFIIEDKSFPLDIREAILNAVEKAEKEFNRKYVDMLNNNIDFSGSCVCIVLIVENKIYVVNIGDSRAIMSLNTGTKIQPLTIDHKPNNPREFDRVIKVGGKVYVEPEEDIDRDIEKLKVIEKESDFDDYLSDGIIFRIYPCHLAVARTIGDIKAKDKSYGGLNGEIISTPDIYTYEINSNMDFIVIGCDGIYDNLSNEDIVDCAWFAIDNCASERKYDINLISLDMCNMIIKNAMDKFSVDNLSVVVIGLDGLEKFINHQKNMDIKNEIKKK